MKICKVLSVITAVIGVAYSVYNWITYEEDEIFGYFFLPMQTVFIWMATGGVIGLIWLVYGFTTFGTRTKIAIICGLVLFAICYTGYLYIIRYTYYHPY